MLTLPYALTFAAMLFLSAPLLAQSGAERDQALIVEAAKGSLPTVEKLLTEGASARAKDAQGRSALNAAAYGNHAAVFRRLLAAGSDINQRDNVPSAPLMTAAVRGYVEIVRLALAAGADVQTINQYGGNALIPACHYGHVEVVRELLKTKIDVNHVNNLGWTALLETIILSDGGPRHQEIMGLLLKHGARTDIADRDGVTPLAHARKRGYKEMARQLEAAGAK